MESSLGGGTTRQQQRQRQQPDGALCVRCRVGAAGQEGLDQ